MSIFRLRPAKGPDRESWRSPIPEQFNFYGYIEIQLNLNLKTSL
jgi:hypothetical protein